MSEPTYKAKSLIEAELVAAHQADPALSEVNSPATNSRWRALYSIIAGGLSLVWGAIRYVYRQFFTRWADETTLDRLIEDFNLAVPDGADINDKRKLVASFRNRLRIGTAPWYEQTVLDNFSGIETVKYIPGARGADTADLVVTPVFKGGIPDDSFVDDIQAFFDAKANKVGTEDLLVRLGGSLRM